MQVTDPYTNEIISNEVLSAMQSFVVSHFTDHELVDASNTGVFSLRRNVQRRVVLYSLVFITLVSLIVWKIQMATTIPAIFALSTTTLVVGSFLLYCECVRLYQLSTRLNIIAHYIQLVKWLTSSKYSCISRSKRKLCTQNCRSIGRNFISC